MYLVGFGAAWWLGRLRAHRPQSGWHEQEVGDLIFYGARGAVLGGRIGYVLFYDLPAFLAEPLRFFKVWEGGMSFHGGLIGVIVAMFLLGRRHHKHFFEIADFTAPLVPIGLCAGRICNFINGELWGKISDVPGAMIFPTGGPLPRHPSQLYEALLEGVLLFVILWTYSRRPRPTMAVSGLFLLCYGLFRFAGGGGRGPGGRRGGRGGGGGAGGQILSTPLIVGGAVLMGWA